MSQSRGIAGSLIAGAALVALACGSGRVESKVRFRAEAEDQAPRLDLSLYKSAEERPGKQNRAHHVVVAVSGGGHRAGNFAFGALLALEKLRCDRGADALKEIDYFSTVSGGGFGVGAYIASLSDAMEAEPMLADAGAFDRRRDAFKLAAAVEEYDGTEEDILRNLECGYNNRAAAAFVSVRAVFTDLDRGDYLESSLDRFLLGARRRGRSLRLNDLWVAQGSAARVRLPSWVANATVFQNGAIFPFSPDVLGAYGVAKYVHEKETQVLPNGNLEQLGELPLAVAMKASASFPALLPATTLEVAGRDPANPYLHLMDGGLADNLGMLSAVSLVRQLEASGSVALVLIDAFNGESEPFSRGSGSPKFYQSFTRSTGISLDSWHSRFRVLLAELLPGRPAVYLGFSSVDDAKLRAAVEAVKTTINVTPKEQEDLMAAAGAAVTKNQKALCAAIFP